ncbi:MAG: valine--tRNA ligase [Patescibacteria group bacterium]
MEEAPNKKYDPGSNEGKMYQLWEEAGIFSAEGGSASGGNPPKGRGVFSMVLPPPNVTGILHIGHALMVTLSDVIVRYRRMRGDKTLWLPGTDHAAIATQEKVERDIYKSEGKTRHDLGREEFLRRVDAFAKASHDGIVHQLRKLGASLDWSREAFTLDEERNQAVKEAFKRMYEAGLIYRGSRIVNWDPKLQTTVSDDEIEWKEEKTNFYYLKYGPFTIATARPETKFGDKYVVMHPEDERYAKYKDGEKLNVEWINGPVVATIVKDKAVDPSFGTGVMTITPAHDAADFDIAERRKLDREQVIDFHGKLLPIAGEFADTHISKARSLIVEKLKSKGLVEKTDENYVHRIATSSRGGGVIEPQLMEQWFVSVSKKFKATSDKINGIKKGSETNLKEIMLKAVEGGQVNIIPERFKNEYFHWIENLRDWCISRQIWYGHRIPVWYRKQKINNNKQLTTEEIRVGEKPEGEGWEQDPDTLDTWFSSGLWTFSTLGWPDACRQTENSKLKTQNCEVVPGSDLAVFHPTSLLVTAYDILFFWVARMILMTGFFLGDVPFKTAYIHGIVRDKDKKKMSKSKGNAIDPLGIAETYGMDAVRMALVVGNAPGSDPVISEDKIRGYRNFATKVWNIARFLNMNEVFTADSGAKLVARDALHMKEFEAVKARVTSLIDRYQLHEAANEIYHYLWHTFADKIVEEGKLCLRSDADAEAGDTASTRAMFREIFRESLILLHPFMPFVTEAIYQEHFAPFSKDKLLASTPWC